MHLKNSSSKQLPMAQFSPLKFMLTLKNFVLRSNFKLVDTCKLFKLKLLCTSFISQQRFQYQTCNKLLDGKEIKTVLANRNGV